MALRRYIPGVERLESIVSLSSLSHRLRATHKPAAHVKPHWVHEPHVTRHTGTLIAGPVACEGVNLDTTTGSATFAGRGQLTIGNAKYAVGVGLSTHNQVGSFCLTSSNGSMLFADVMVMTNLDGGDYTIRQATGDFAGAKGTGIFLIKPTADGYLIGFNPHE